MRKKFPPRRGRLRRSPFTRREQVNNAQHSFCERMQAQNKRLLRAYVPEVLLEALDEDAAAKNEGRGERLTAILTPIYRKGSV